MTARTTAKTIAATMPTKILTTVAPLISRLNLIYHVYPARQNDFWLYNIAELRARWRIFNGRKIVAAAIGPNTYSLADVVQAFDGLDPQPTILPFPNDPQLREVATFLPLLQAVQSVEPNEATFYGHTKCNTTAGQLEGAWLWTQRMYATLLGQIQVVRDALQVHPLVGCCKMTWPRGARSVFPSKLAVGNWIFAGTFFWFRHDRIYTHPRWNRVMQDRYGAEAWPSTIVCDHHEAATLYQPWPAEMYPAPSPYNPRTHRACSGLCQSAISNQQSAINNQDQSPCESSSPESPA
jgi:hypothetical protein